MPRGKEQAPNGYLSPEVAAEVLHTTPDTIRNRIRNNAMPGRISDLPSGEKRYYVDRKAVLHIASADINPNLQMRRQAVGLELEDIVQRYSEDIREERQMLVKGQMALVEGQQRVGAQIGKLAEALESSIGELARSVRLPFYLLLLLNAIAIFLHLWQIVP